MTGIKQFNIPQFQAVASWLRAKGYDVISPVELDSAEMREAALLSKDGVWDHTQPAPGSNETWGTVLGRDVAVVANAADGVALLPNWHRSKGARLEAFVALLCGKPLFLVRPSTVTGEWYIDPYRSSDVLLDIALSFDFNPGV
jgi:hypothetical protein